MAPFHNSPKNKRDAEATQTRILRAAEELFVRHGFDGTRIDAIAEAARSNKRMIYVYFGNKEQLYLEVLKRNFEKVIPLARLVDPAQTPTEQATTVISHYFRYLSDNPAFLRLLGWESLREGRLAGKALVDVAAAEFEALHGILQRGIEQGEFRPDLDIPKTVMSITALCFSFFNRRFLWATLWGQDLTRPETLNDVLAHTLDLVFRGIRSPCSSPKA
ncbi:MAG TPA: TetR/AcrR family transcriptional regulator [Polyangiaceae bacterium]|jgi:TetR/AcrR family transcriptional regulator|nr:MAG: HTH-type transcriptional repressor NicS [Deltaproteobacteria bacterium ADurb.Bin207]HNS95830.1 TetR/AcrR family transcriptional regulator [Polyangiaceae bacterium]HNZ21469.1 TetR/AcrR family transcriptional regulator [Polyangiaceae bacterium]HOD23648.1 TetR/AcrR family transcriptional regulator [Polyangiaceae bacterium]HOE50052.1 TetR/AcrR family transcriptional regulator [Polyangiaceae bacterium]